MVPGGWGQSELLPGIQAHCGGVMSDGATATAAAAPPEAGLVATASGARRELAGSSRARGVIAELSLAAGLRELVPGVRDHNGGIRARGDSCDDAP